MGKKAAICFVVSILLTVGVVGWAILYYLLPGYYFEIFPLVAALFIVLSAVAVWLSARWEMRIRSGEITQSRAAMSFLALKMGKLLFLALLLLVFWAVFDNLPKSFFVVFALYYLISLFFETIAITALTRYYNQK